MQRWIASTIVVLALSGCATVNHMAFDNEATNVDTRSKSVVLMTLDIGRDDDSRFVPEPLVVKLERPDAQTKEERQNFKLDTSDDSIEENGHRVFLLRMALAPGPYTLFEVFGRARAFPINAFFVVPVMASLDVPGNSVTYVGRITARLRPRSETEFRAGPVIPLLDQAIAGISNSTWDITIDDRYDHDLVLFRDNFPALSRASIGRRLLPPFDRALVQRRWDGEATTAGQDQTTAAPAK